MFESVGLPHVISKADFDAEEPNLRGDLIDAQFELLEQSDFPVIVLLSGMDVLGRSEAAKQLLSWMDPRHIRPYASMGVSDEELTRPRMWRYWRALPRKGRVGVFLNSWYDGCMFDFLLGRIKRSRVRARIDEVARFEQLLAREGSLLVKFLFVLPRDQELKELVGTPLIDEHRARMAAFGHQMRGVMLQPAGLVPAQIGIQLLAAPIGS